MKTWAIVGDALVTKETIGQSVAGLVIARLDAGKYEVLQVATGLSIPNKVYDDVKAARDVRDALAELADWTVAPTNGHYTAVLAAAGDAVLVEDFDVAVGKARERWDRCTAWIRKAGKPR